VSAWAPGGVLLLEEVDRIDTDDAVFAEYLDRQREMLRGHGQTLDIGPRLAAQVCAASSETAPRSPDPRVVARMFALNYESWCEDPDEAIADGLAQRAGGTVAAGAITWRMRQIAIRAQAGVGAAAQ
jgi:hypothetical protein